MDTDPGPPQREATELHVPVRPVDDAGPRRPRVGPIVAAAGLVASLAVAVGLAQLFPARQTASPEAVVSPAPAVRSTVVASPSPRAPLALPVRLRAAELVAGARDGSLDGWLVYADASLRAGCRARLLGDCEMPDVAVDGLGLDVVVGEPARTSTVRVPDDALLVLAVRGQRLEYLGSLVVRGLRSRSLAAVDEEWPSAAAAVAPSLLDVRGWLVNRPTCVRPALPTEVCERAPFLADDMPRDDRGAFENRGRPVRLSPAVWGVDPATDEVSEGPFLVRALRAAGPGDPRWEVVARYVPSRSVRVVIP